MMKRVGKIDETLRNPNREGSGESVAEVCVLPEESLVQVDRQLQCLLFPREKFSRSDLQIERVFPLYSRRNNLQMAPDVRQEGINDNVEIVIQARDEHPPQNPIRSPFEHKTKIVGCADFCLRNRW